LAKSAALIPEVGVPLISPDIVPTAVLAKLPARAAAPVNAPVMADDDGKENPPLVPDNVELIKAVAPPAPVVN
jgi:hypothetical protein